MSGTRLATSIVWAGVLVVAALRVQAEDSGGELFRTRIEPVLRRHCYECHSHDSGRMKGGLTLDSRSGWAEGGESGPAIVPGRPEESLLLAALRHESLKMPPAGRLPEEILADFVRWIEAGAPDPRVRPATPPATADWWSLRPLARPALPPALEGEDLHPIDRFVRAQLTEKGLAPSPVADRRTLLRRVMFDLNGLPPRWAEVEEFERDSDPQAYERLVDRLLDSPRFGERWARHWLDTIHFAETHGYEHDLPRDHAWRYRDYVIESFHRDTPWPQFIREQIAADHFFPDEPRLAAALGFLGAGTFDHSSFTTAPVTFDYLDRDDLVAQTMSAFASTTANCARCHDHKFDPISQEDYYALQAVFAGIVEGDVAFDDDPDISRRRRQWRERLAAAESRDASVLLAAGNAALASEWLERRGSGAEFQPLPSDTFLSTEGSTLTREPDGALSASGRRPEKDVYLVTVTSPLRTMTALRLEVLTHDALPRGGPGRQDNGNFHLSELEVQVFEAAESGPRTLKFRHATADFDQDGWDILRAIDGKAETAWGIHPAVGASHHAVFELETPLETRPGMKLVVVLKQLHGQGHLIGRFRLSATGDPAERAAAMPAAVEQALRIPPTQRSQTQQIDVAAFALRARAREELRQLPPQLRVYGAAASAEVVLAVGPGSPRVVTPPKVVHVLRRGDFGQPLGEAVPGALSVLTHAPARFMLKDPRDEAARRAALADWLAHPDNPLTWRSIANRVWHYHFGRGLCDTPSDFGRMGGTPSHPELLDWLAAELRDSGGSLKHLHRLIVTSATYRQQSVARAEAARIDADNRLLWRMHRARLDADAVRDFMLAAADRLDLAQGGPSVREFSTGPPVQITPTLDYTTYDWSAKDRHRRGIYRFVWRGIPDPFLESLDFPDMGLLTPVRSYSSSSLQALALYNNAFVLYVSEQAARQVERSGNEIDRQVQEAVRRILLRDPRGQELHQLAAFARQYGLPALCRVLYNTNEFLFVD